MHDCVCSVPSAPVIKSRMMIALTGGPSGPGGPGSPARPSAP